MTGFVVEIDATRRRPAQRVHCQGREPLTALLERLARESRCATARLAHGSTAVVARVVWDADARRYGVAWLAGAEVGQ